MARFSGGGDKGPPRDGRQSPQPVRRQQTPRRDARQRHFRNQTVGPHKVEIVVVIVEAGPADIIDKAFRGNAAIDRNDLVVLKLHMPVVEPRRHLLKRQEADWGSVLRQRAGVDQHVAEQQGVIARHGQRSVRQVRAEGAGLDAHGLAAEFDGARVGDGLPSWVSTRSPGCRVSMARSPSGVAILAPVAKQLKTCAEVSMNPVEAPPPVKGARSNASF